MDLKKYFEYESAYPIGYHKQKSYYRYKGGVLNWGHLYNCVFDPVNKTVSFACLDNSDALVIEFYAVTLEDVAEHIISFGRVQVERQDFQYGKLYDEVRGKQ